MSDVTSILHQIESGDPSAADQLLPMVYEELRKLAQEKRGQTLQATALVHEAYLRLVGSRDGEPRAFLCCGRRGHATHPAQSCSRQGTPV